MRSRVSTTSRKSAIKIAVAALFASLAAGCSSDVIRFQDGFYTGEDRLTTASIPGQQNVVPPQNVGNLPGRVAVYDDVPGQDPRSQAFPAAPSASPPVYDTMQTGTVNSTPNRYRTTSAGGSVQTSSLPPVDNMITGPRSPRSQPFPEMPRQAATSRPASNPVSNNAGMSGTSGRVMVQPGETISSLSRRYGVSTDAIIKANGIADASHIRVGQVLVIPGLSKMNAPADRSPAPAPAHAPDRQKAVLTKPAEQRRAETVKPVSNPGSNAASASTGNGGIYTVQSGDTLTKIARRNNVSVDALKAANGLSGSAIRIGQRLSVPAPGSTATPDRSVVTATTPKNTQTAKAPKEYTPPVRRSVSVEEAAAKTEVVEAAPENTGIGKLRWPVRGQVIDRFGRQADGERNDGIDISVPEGTDVKAAENGVVIYAGSGLKEYGNTVLVRHEDGLVTVYGHASQLKVNRGDKVNRGQVIASSGMSGSAKSPRLHFEVRKDASPVDPTGFLN